MSNVESTYQGSKSNPQFGLEVGTIKHLFDKLRELKTIDNLDFSDRLAISDIVWEAWYCGFNDRFTLYKL